MSANINKPNGHPNRAYKGSGPVGKLPKRATMPRPRINGPRPFRTRRDVAAFFSRRWLGLGLSGPHPHPTKKGPGRF